MERSCNCSCNSSIVKPAAPARDTNSPTSSAVHGSAAQSGAHGRCSSAPGITRQVWRRGRELTLTSVSNSRAQGGSAAAIHPLAPHPDMLSLLSRYSLEHEIAEVVRILVGVCSERSGASEEPVVSVCDRAQRG